MFDFRQVHIKQQPTVKLKEHLLHAGNAPSTGKYMQTMHCLSFFMDFWPVTAGTKDIPLITAMGKPFPSVRHLCQPRERERAASIIITWRTEAALYQITMFYRA